MTCEADLTKVSTVDTEQQWTKFSPGISCQSNYSSRVFFKTPTTLASMKRADKITSLTSGHSTTNTTHSILTEGGTPHSFCGDPLLTKLERATSKQKQRQGQRRRQRSGINPKDKGPPPSQRTIKTPQHSQHFNNTKHKAEYKSPDSNAEQNHATIILKAKIRAMGEKVAKNLQTMSE